MTYHHGITAQELTQGILPMRNATTSVIGVITTSADADKTHFPDNTPVLLTGITKTDIAKAGKDGTLVHVLQQIRDIHSPTIVVLNVTNPDDVDVLDILEATKSRLGVYVNILSAPALDTPKMVRKMLALAKKNDMFVYASPRKDNGDLITDKAEIVAYRDTFGEREFHLIEGLWGEPDAKTTADANKPKPSYASIP